MGDKLEFTTEADWDSITSDIAQNLNEYAKKIIGREITEDDIEDYKVTIKIELSLF